MSKWRTERVITFAITILSISGVTLTDFKIWDDLVKPFFDNEPKRVTQLSPAPKEPAVYPDRYERLKVKLEQWSHGKPGNEKALAEYEFEQNEGKGLWVLPWWMLRWWFRLLLGLCLFALAHTILSLLPKQLTDDDWSWIYGIVITILLYNGTMNCLTWFFWRIS